MPFEKFLHNSIFNLNERLVTDVMMIRCTPEFQLIMSDLNLNTCDDIKERVELIIKTIIPDVESINNGRLMTILCLIQHVLIHCVLNHHQCDFRNTIKRLSDACKYLTTLLIPKQCIILCNFMRFVEEC